MRDCIRLSNSAVQLFEKGDFSHAALVYKAALAAFKSDMLFSKDDPLRALPLQCSPRIQVYYWSQRVQPNVPNKEGVFVFARAAYLCPDSFTHAFQDYYSTFILYNVALCYHMLTKSQGAADENSESARGLYNMTFEAIKLSAQPNNMLLVIVFNNFGQLMYNQWRTHEAVKCFEVVHELMNTTSMTSFFDADDFSGLCLNSLMDSNTASAA